MSTYSFPTGPNQAFRRSNGNNTSSRRRRLSLSQGRLAEPSRVINKAEREQREKERKDSITNIEQEREEYERSWTALGDKIASSIWVTRGLHHLDQAIEHNFAPACSTSSIQSIRTRQNLHNLRSLLVTLLLLLTVFGALWVVIEYLLLATRASACSVSTVYIPIPFTVTTGADGATLSDPASAAVSYTSTTTQTFVSYVTVPPSSSSAQPYVYTVDPSGSTSWLNGVSPDPGASLITATTSVYLQPVPTITSTASDPGKLGAFPDLEPETITPDAYTSTAYSYVGPDSTSTSTSTSTHYVTYTVSHPSPSGISLSTARPSFQGVSSGGWNATSSTDPNHTTEVVETTDQILTTLTATYFFGTGQQTTSTSTTHITTTIALTYTVTVPPQSGSPNEHGTGLPITLTPGTAFSTSIPESTVNSNAASSSLGPSEPAISSSLSSVPASSTSSPASTPHITTTWSNGGTAMSVSTSSGGSRSITWTYSGVLNTTDSCTTSGLETAPGTVSLSSGIPSTSGITAPNPVTTAPGPISLSSRSSASHATPNGQSTPSSLLSTGSAIPASPAGSSASGSSLSHISKSMTTTTRGKSSLSMISNSTLIHGTSATTSRSSSSSSAVHSIVTSNQSSSNVRASTTSSFSFSNPFPASSATAAPSGGCGEHGNFMIGFDELPNFTPSNPNATDITQAPTIFSPYHHLTFSGGYVYAPQPHEPFPPTSPPHLAVYLADNSGMAAKASHPGEIGDGSRESMSAFWFDAYSAYMGCDNPGPGPCTMVFSGYTWNPTANDEVLAYTQNQTLPNCHDFIDCHLQKVNFPPSFRGLTGLQIQAFIGNQQRMFFMDDLALGWSNNSCAAGLERQSSQ